jgi:hypothetical protein
MKNHFTVLRTKCGTFHTSRTAGCTTSKVGFFPTGNTVCVMLDRDVVAEIVSKYRKFGDKVERASHMRVQ